MTGNFEVRAQMFAADGTRVGSQISVNANTSGNQFIPKITALEGGGFVATWTDGTGDAGSSGTTTGVKAQIFDSEGGRPVGEVLVNQTVNGNQTNPTISDLPGGGFVAVWADGSIDSLGGVRARIFNAAGVGGTEFSVNLTTVQTQSRPVVTTLANGNIVVAWQDDSGNAGSAYGDGSAGGIVARIFEADGDPVTGEFVANSIKTGHQTAPIITNLTGGGFVIVWSGPNEIQGQIFAADGSKVGGEFTVNTTIARNQLTPTVAALDDGSFIVAWDDNSGLTGDTWDGGSHGIVAQVFSATGARIGTEFLVNTTIAQNQTLPDITGLPDGGFAVTWTDFSGTGGDASSGSMKLQRFGLSDGAISDIGLSGNMISETIPEGNVVGTLTSNGPVNNDRVLTYTIVSDTTGGAFSVRGDQLFVADNNRLDFETMPSASVVVKVSDEYGNSYEEALTLNVTDAAIEQRIGGDSHVVAGSVGTRLAPHEVASLADGGFVMVWQGPDASGVDTAPNAIHAQLYDSKGDAVGTTFVVNTIVAGSQTEPFAVGLPGGGFFVTWMSPNGSSGVIKGKIFNADGTVAVEEFLVSTTATVNQHFPTSSVLADGNIVVTWQDGNDGAGDVKGTILSGSTGVSVVPEFALHAVLTNSQERPYVLATEDGGFVATWVDKTSAGTIKAKQFDANGVGGAEFQVNVNSAMNQLEPTVTQLANGNLVFAWRDYSGVGGDTSNGGIQLRLFTPGTGFISGEMLANTATNDAQRDPRIVALPNGGFLVVWDDASTELNFGNVKAQLFAADGSKIGTEFMVNQEVLYEQKVPSVAVLESGDIVISWSDASGAAGAGTPVEMHYRILGAAETNAAPLLDLNGAAAGTEYVTTYDNGGAPVAIVDAGMTITDAEGHDLHGATVTLHDMRSGDMLSAEGVLPDGISVSFATVDNMLVATLTGIASADDYRVALGQLRFSSTDMDAGNGTEDRAQTITITVSDGADDSIAARTTITLALGPVNQAPSGTGGVIAVDENATRTLAIADFPFSDPEGHGLSAVIIATRPVSGILWFDADGDGGAGAARVTEGQEISVEDIAAGKLTYVPEPDTAGSGVASFTYQVRDDGGTANGGADLDATPDTLSIDIIAAANEAPTIAFGAAALEAVEQVALSLKGAITIDDVDAETGTITVALSVDAGILQVAAGTSGAIVTGSGTASVGISGSLAEIQALLGSDGDNVVSFTADEDAPAATASLTVDVNDGGHSGAGGAQTATLATTITVAPVNDAPVLGNLDGDILAYVEDDGAIRLDTGLAVTLADADSVDFDGGSLVIAFVLGACETARAEDVLAFAADVVTIGQDGEVVVDGAAIGTLTGDGTNGAPLEVDFNANATPALVGMLVGAATYANLSNDPDLASRTVAFTLVDGDGTDLSGKDMAEAQVTVGVTATDDPVAAADDAESVDEDQIVTIDVLANDTDVDGPAPTIAKVDDVVLAEGESTILASGATVTLQGGKLVYDPSGMFDHLTDGTSGAVNTWAEDSFTYELASGELATVSVTVNGVASVGDVLNGDEGDNVITGTPDQDFFDIGQGGNDTLYGLDENDIIFLGHAFTAGDSIDGGDGLDLVILGDVFDCGCPVDPLVVTLGESTLTSVEWLGIFDGNSYSITTHDNTVAAGELMQIDASGLSLENILTFDGSAETDGMFDVFGGAGNDSITGGGGDDFVDGDEGDDLIAGGGGRDYILGGNGDDVITGGDGGDYIDGGLGDDDMQGGFGDDTYEVSSEDDQISEDDDAGTDRVLSYLAAYTLGDHVENLRGMLAIDQILHGNALSNDIVGNDGNDSLDGFAGNDRMQGMAGDDNYVVDSAGDKVIELGDEGSDLVQASVSFSLAGQYVEELELTGTGNINATGNGLDNRLTGNDGNNRLNGGIGADAMSGGLGNDVYVIDNIGDQVTENGDAGTDRIESRIGYTLGAAGLEHVENLFLTGTAQINATGNGLDNEIHGNDAGNIIDGGAGADRMVGGLGNDRYIVDESGDTILEKAGGGVDTVESAVSFSLAGQYVEVLRLTGTGDIDGTGNGQADTIFGNGGDNVISTGGADDKLYGGDGNDTLTGGAGADRFIFDAPLGAENVDAITDFDAADDAIYLDRSDFAGVNVGALRASLFYAGTGAHDANDRIIYDKDTGSIFFDGDGDGAGTQVLFATVAPATILIAADFIGF